MKPYETTLILDPQLQEEGWEQMIEKYGTIISRKGTIKRTDRWGLRRLAYEIKRRSQGYYVHFIHESPTDVPRDIERQCLLDENCLRHLTVVADNPKYQEEMDKRQATRESAAAVAAPAGASDSPAASTGADETVTAPGESEPKPPADEPETARETEMQE